MGFEKSFGIKRRQAEHGCRHSVLKYEKKSFLKIWQMYLFKVKDLFRDTCVPILVILRWAKSAGIYVMVMIKFCYCL